MTAIPGISTKMGKSVISGIQIFQVFRYFRYSDIAGIQVSRSEIHVIHVRPIRPVISVRLLTFQFDVSVSESVSERVSEITARDASASKKIIQA